MEQNGYHAHTNGGSDPYLLQGDFFLYPKSKYAYNVTLNANQLSWRDVNRKKSQSLSLKDIIGCDCMKGKTDNDSASYLTIYAYPHRRKFASKKTLRKRQTLTIMFTKHATRLENEKEAQIWWTVIKCLLKKVIITPSQDFSQLTIPVSKKLLVLVNPFSGPGTALTLFQERVVPMLAEAGLLYHMIVTEFAGHGRNLMRSLDLDEWAGVVIVSGDGLIYEVINGLMDREDWEAAIKMPIGCLPGGSGNALCVSMLHAAGEPVHEGMMLHATFALIKHEVVPMDLIAVDTSAGKRMYSFLSISWGLVSDVDIESERFRSMGNARFTIGALVRIAGLRKYHGRISFLPAGDFVPGPISRSHSICEANVTQMPITKQPPRSVSMSEEFTVHRSRHSSELESLPESMSEASLSSTVPNNLVRVNVNGDESNENASNNRPRFTLESSEDPAVQIIPTPLLNQLSEPVPENWITIDSNFIQFVAACQTHLNKDFIVNSNCRFNDGVIHLALTPGTTTRRQLIQQFSEFEEGKIHLNPDIELLRVQAFRLDPITPPGTMAVDGELVDYGPIQAQVLPSMARLMTIAPNYQITQL